MVVQQIKDKLNQKKPLFIGEETAMKSAVLIPLIEKNGEWHVLFEVRSATLRKQPGDISFPGGKIDANETPLEAVIREVHEELGIDTEKIEIIDALSAYIMSPTFVVYPFVGILHDAHHLQCNDEEVEEVFTVPLNWLLNHEPELHKIALEPKFSEDFPFEKIYNGKNYKWRRGTIDEWFYHYEGYAIWGLTARVLKHFIQLMK